MQLTGNITEGMKMMSIDNRKRSVPAQTRNTSNVPTESIHKSNRPHRDRSIEEIQGKNIKCFNCNEKGHFASSCPKGRLSRGSLRVHTDQIETMPDEERTVSEEINLWTRVLTLKQSVEEQSLYDWSSLQS